MSKTQLIEPFYYCNLNLAKDFDCEHKDECKRWLHIKDEEYNRNRSGRLFNVCSKTNYSLFLKENLDIIKKEDDESVSNENSSQ